MSVDRLTHDYSWHPTDAPSTWSIPPENQGQIVEISYLCLCDVIVRRYHDRSDGEISFEIAAIGDDDWGWYDDWDPAANETPAEVRDLSWRATTAQQVRRLALI